MSTHTKRLVLVLLTVGALVLVAMPMAVAGDQVPVRERMSGYTYDIQYAPGFPTTPSDFDGRCSVPSHWVSYSSGEGVMSHLGRVTSSSSHCFQFGAPPTFSDARLLITAASGDMLFATYDGVMTGETTFAETMVILGGTGRFVGATGEIAEAGWFDPATGYMEIVGEGWITYEASNRRATPK